MRTVGVDPGRTRPVRRPDPNPAASEPASCAPENPEFYTILWAAAVLLVFVPLSNAQYRRPTSR